MTTINESAGHKFSASELMIEAILEAIEAAMNKVLTAIGSPGPTPDAIPA